MAWKFTYFSWDQKVNINTQYRVTARILESGGHDQIGLTNALMWISTPSQRILWKIQSYKANRCRLYLSQRHDIFRIIHMVMDFWEVPITFTFLIITNEIPVCSSILAYQPYWWSSPLSYFIKFMWWAKTYEALPRWELEGYTDSIVIETTCRAFWSF